MIIPTNVTGSIDYTATLGVPVVLVGLGGIDPSRAVNVAGRTVGFIAPYGAAGQGDDLWYAEKVNRQPLDTHGPVRGEKAVEAVLRNFLLQALESQEVGA